MKIAAKLRREITERANGICEYCISNSKFSQDPFDIEHIIPVSEGGESVSANLALSCHGCNLYKSKKTSGYDLLSEENVRLFHPRNDDWNEHFTWVEDFSLITGLTPVGRTTVETLKLNREGLVNQRKALHRLDLHPPF